MFSGVRSGSQGLRTGPLAAGGRYVQSAAQYETGPDGKQYAVGGEVGVDASEVQDDSQATVQKAQVIRRAVLAPAYP